MICHSFKCKHYELLLFQARDMFIIREEILLIYDFQLGSVYSKGYGLLILKLVFMGLENERSNNLSTFKLLFLKF